MTRQALGCCLSGFKVLILASQKLTKAVTHGSSDLFLFARHFTKLT